MFEWFKARFARAARMQPLSLIANWLANALWTIEGKFLSLAKETYGQNEAIYACLRFLSQAVPEAPLKAYQEDREGKRTPLERDNPLCSLIAHPNELQTQFEFWELTTLYLAIIGRACWWKERNNAGQVVALWPIRPDRIDPIYSNSDVAGERVLSGWSYQTPDSGALLPIARRDVLSFNLPDPAGESGGIVEGIGPVQALARQVASDNEATKFVGALLANYAAPMTVLKMSSPVNNADEARLVKARFRAEFGGAHRGLPALIDAATDIQTVGFDLQQLEFPELREVAESRIAAALGIPAILVGLRVGLQSSTFCLPATARVSTPDGPRPIVSLRAGDSVWSMVNDRLEARPILESHKTGHKLIYKIQTKNRTLRATGNHPVLVRVAGNSDGANGSRHAYTEWRRVDQLTTQDCIVQPKQLPDLGGWTLPDGEMATPEFMQFCGALVGDGTVYRRSGISMAMPPGDRCHDYYMGLAQQLFTRDLPTCRKHVMRCLQCGAEFTETEWRVNDGRGRFCSKACLRLGREAHMAKPAVIVSTIEVPRVPVRVSDRGRSFGFSSLEVARRMDAFGFGGRALTKRIPSWVYGLSEELRLAFIAGLVDSDGTIDKRGAMKIAFANLDLLLDVKELLLSVGIRTSNVYHHVYSPDTLPQPGTRDAYHAYAIVASSAVDVARIPFKDGWYRERVNANTQRDREDGRNAEQAGLGTDFGFYKVVSIEPESAEDVYDIEVDGGHCFVADGVVVHNSNFREARRLFTESTLTSYWRRYADQYQADIVPEFGDDIIVEFDTSQVRGLADQRAEAIEPLATGFEKGAVTRNEYRQALGLDPTDDGDVYVLPANMIPVEATVPQTAKGLPPHPAHKAAPVEGDVTPPFVPTVQDADARRAKLAAELEKALADIQVEVVETIEAGNMPGRDAVGKGLDKPLMAGLEAAVQARMTAAALAVGVSLDTPVINQYARNWLASYIPKLKTELDATTFDMVRPILEDYLATPGMTRGDLEARLQKVPFGPVRASTIAVTEITRANAEGTRMLQKHLADQGIKKVRVWNTIKQDVCDICLAREGLPESEWGGYEPPAHPNCQCDVSMTGYL